MASEVKVVLVGQVTEMCECSGCSRGDFRGWRVAVGDRNMRVYSTGLRRLAVGAVLRVFPTISPVGGGDGHKWRFATAAEQAAWRLSD